MAGLFGALQSSVLALNAQSRAIEVTGHNLANVDNPNYARQRVIFGDRGTVVTPDGAQSLGLEALGVQQLRDALLDKQVVREIGLSNSYQTQQQAYQRAQAALGESVDSSAISGDSTSNTGFSNALDSFFNAFQDLASRPTDVGVRQTLLQQSQVLTDRLQLTDTRLSQIQSDLDAQVSGNVTTANTLLSQISDLNAQISRVELNAPGSAVDLRDQRQARLESLAAILPVETQDLGNGSISLTTKGADGSAVTLVDGAGVQAPIAYDPSTGLTAGSSATPISPASGSIQGALVARSGPVQDLRDQLDALAKQLVTSVNAAYNPSGTAGQDFFDPSGTSASTISLRSGLTSANITSGNGAAGDNSIALAVAAVANKTFSTSSGDSIDGTFSQYFAHSVSQIGQSLSTANSRVEDQSSIESLVRSQRDTVSGVSMDEEMSDLVRYQRAYQANSRVFSILDQLLETVVTQLG